MVAWGTMMTVWLAGAPFSKPTARSTPTSTRLLQGAMMAAGYFLMSGWVEMGWLSRPLWTQTLTVAGVGLAVTCVGLGWAIWARLTLGSNWSAKPVVREAHELIMRGPYKLTRHPIYTGLLLAALGTSMAVDAVRCVAGMALLITAMLIKIRQEEQLMTETFPGQYPEYCRRVKALAPFIW